LFEDWMMFSPNYATMASTLSGFVAMRDQRAATVFGKVKILLKLQLLCYLLLA